MKMVRGDGIFFSTKTEKVTAVISAHSMDRLKAGDESMLEWLMLECMKYGNRRAVNSVEIKKFTDLNEEEQNACT